MRDIAEEGMVVPGMALLLGLPPWGLTSFAILEIGD